MIDPICMDGFVPIRLKMAQLKIFVLFVFIWKKMRGKIFMLSMSNESFVDLNRAGTPLLEIVTHPDITSTYEAKNLFKSASLDCAIS